MDVTPICLCCFGRGGSSIGWNLIGSSADVLMTSEEWHRIVFDGAVSQKLRRLIVGGRRRSLPTAAARLQRALSPLYAGAVKRKTIRSVPSAEWDLKPNARHLVIKVMDHHIDLLPAISAAFGNDICVVVLTREAEPQIESLLRSNLTLAQACRWYNHVIGSMSRLLEEGAMHLKFEDLIYDPGSAITRLYEDLQIAPPPNGKYRVKAKTFGEIRTATTDVTSGKMLHLSLDELRGFIDRNVNRKAVGRLSPSKLAVIRRTAKRLPMCQLM